MSNKVGVYLKCIAFIIFTLVKVCCFSLLGIQPTDWIKSGRNTRQCYNLTITNQRCKTWSTFCKTKPTAFKRWWGSLTLWYIKPASNTCSLMCFLAWIKIKQNQLVDLLASCKHLVEKRKCSSYHPGMRNGHCVNVPVTKREKERHKETGQDRRGLRNRVLPCFQQAAHDVEVHSVFPALLGFCSLVPELWLWHCGRGQRKLQIALEPSESHSNALGLGFLAGFSQTIFRLPSGTERLLEEGKPWNFLVH